MTVTGSTLDPAGKPMPGVPVDFVGRPRVPYVAAVETFDAYTLLGQGATGDDGQFHVDITRTSSTRFFDVYALAKAPGYGLSWIAPNPDDRHPSAQIRLRPEQPIRGRMVDVNGQPATNVEVHAGADSPPLYKWTNQRNLFLGSPPRRAPRLAGATSHRRSWPFRARRFGRRR